MYRDMKTQAMAGNTVENCAHWFRFQIFQISANTLVYLFFFRTSKLSRVNWIRKLIFFRKSRDSQVEEKFLTF